jgi:hypothetical protein
MHHGPKAAKQCRLSEDYGHRDTLAANWGDPNDPFRKCRVHHSISRHYQNLCGGELRGCDRCSRQALTTPSVMLASGQWYIFIALALRLGMVSY